MNVFVRSITQILKGILKAFKTFPASIACASAFAILTMIRIQLDSAQQLPYKFMFDCLDWSLATGAVVSLAAITGAQSRVNKPRVFLSANLLGAVAAIVTFFGLYFFGGTYPTLVEPRYAGISTLAVTRVAAAILVSIIAFIYLAGYPKDKSDFSRALFMTQKAFFIALIYGLVIMAGTSGVAGATKALLYPEMSSKVYMYIGTLSGFLAYTIFVGYFPDFRKGQSDAHRDVVQKQPRFVEILFEYIIIPMVLALTIVLLVWAGKTLFSGTAYSFVQLSGIATAYTVAGIWLHFMVTHYETVLAKIYRLIYPISALVILAFEAWAIIIQLQKSGLKITEYSFIVVWILAAASAVLLLAMKAKAHPVIAASICIMAVLVVLPGIGYQALPVTAQLGRLEKLLVNQGMLKGGKLIPAVSQPNSSTREAITDAVVFLSQAQDTNLPAWFDKQLGDRAVFSAKLGFDQSWPQNSNTIPDVVKGSSLILQPEAFDVSGYRWAINMQNSSQMNGQTSVAVKGNKGTYRITWSLEAATNLPTLEIELDNRTIIKQSLKAYVDRITASYPPGQARPFQAPLKDMSLQLESQEVKVLLVFSNININVDSYPNITNYWLNLSDLYLQEKP